MSMNDSRLKPNTARPSDQASFSSGPRWRMQCWASRTAGDRGVVDAVGVGGEVGEQATHQAQVLGVGGVDGSAGSDALAGARLPRGVALGEKDRNGTVPASMVSTVPLRRPLGPQRQVDGGEEEQRVQPAVRRAEDDDRRRACPPKYFSGTATTISSDQQDADDVGHDPVALQRRGDRLLGVAGRRRSGQRPWLLLRWPSALLVELGEVGVVGGQLGVSGRVDARALVEDDVAARRAVVGVAVQLDRGPCAGRTTGP